MPSAGRGGLPFAAAESGSALGAGTAVRSASVAVRSVCVSLRTSLLGPERGGPWAAPLSGPAYPELVALGDVDVLLRVRVSERVVGEDVRRDSRVDGGGDVRVDQRHRGPFRQLLTRELVELLAGERAVLL